MLSTGSSCLPRSRLRGMAWPGACVAAILAAWVLPATGQQGMPPAQVKTAPVSVEMVAAEVTLPGTVLPWRESLVAAEIEGRVLERRVEEGDGVDGGAVLVRLDPTRHERAMAVAVADREEVGAELALAIRRETRARELFAGTVLPEGDLDAAISQRKALEARLQSLAAQIDTIRDDLGRTEIRAPIRGVVTGLQTEVGEWINRGDPVARLTDLETLKIRLEVPERYFPRLTPGSPAPATVDSLPGVELEGSIFALVPRADQEARTFPVIIRAGNPGRRAASGMLARVKLSVGNGSEALVVPKDAVVRSAGNTTVFVVSDGAARLVPVRTGRSVGSSVEVDGDLEAGDRVVVRGNERLIPGQSVVEVAADRDEAPSAERRSE